jgi:hypothetical protein
LWRFRLATVFTELAEDAIAMIDQLRPATPSTPRRPVPSYVEPDLKAYLTWSANGLTDPYSPEADAAALQEVALALEESITDDLLRAHPLGYSTTTRDLVHDLLPF